MADAAGACGIAEVWMGVWRVTIWRVARPSRQGCCVRLCACAVGCWGSMSMQAGGARVMPWCEPIWISQFSCC